MSNQTDLSSIMGTLDELAAATRNDDDARPMDLLRHTAMKHQAQ